MAYYFEHCHSKRSGSRVAEERVDLLGDGRHDGGIEEGVQKTEKECADDNCDEDLNAGIDMFLFYKFYHILRFLSIMSRRFVYPKHPIHYAIISSKTKKQRSAKQ